jgi:ABC-type lipoprotein release transport system permease subunit
VVKGGLAMGAVGVGIGLVGAALGSRLLTSLLYGVGRLDPMTFVVVPILILASALGATWLPARRAVRIAPIEVLRGE